MNEIEFETIVAKYKSNLFTIAFQYFKNSHDADDVVQEVFFKLYKCKTPFENEQHTRYWLIRVTINQCKQILRSPVFSRTLPIEDYIEQVHFDAPEQSELFVAVMELPKKYRMVIHLYYYEGYATKEIAQLLSIKETTVSTQLMRARSLLKNKLQEEFYNEQQTIIPRHLF